MQSDIRKSDQYTVPQVAAILGVDPETVRRWIRENEIEAVMTSRGTGGGYRIRHEELVRQVQARYPYLALNLRMQS
ncbi:hypothetical protein BH23CHL2_BH23CHL2_26040 [soil metagenome]